MKGLILSGGTGSRLRPLTYTGAKQLIPVANKPILFYAIEAVCAAGVRDIGIVVGDTRDEVTSAVGDGSRFGARVTYVEQQAPLGLAHAVKVARPFLGDDSFVMFLGDNLLRGGISGPAEAFASTPQTDALIMLSRVVHPERFGVAELDARGRVVRLTEKPREPRSDLALVGVYFFRPAVFGAVESVAPSWRNELEITDAIQWLIDHGRRVEPRIVDGWWKDTGRPEDILDANRLVLEDIEPCSAPDAAVDEHSQVVGRVVIESGARIVSSVVRGPAIIGRSSLIQNSYIGPFTSVSASVTVVDSEIENSVVMEGTAIRGIRQRIDSSLIGKNVLVEGGNSRPAAFRLVLGDSSQVTL